MTSPATQTAGDDFQVSPDPARVIGRLSGRIAELESENAQLQDVIRQLLEQRNTDARAVDAAKAASQ